MSEEKRRTKHRHQSKASRSRQSEQQKANEARIRDLNRRKAIRERADAKRAALASERVAPVEAPKEGGDQNATVNAAIAVAGAGTIAGSSQLFTAARILSEVSKAVEGGQRGLGANITGSSSVAAAQERMEQQQEAARTEAEKEKERIEKARKLAESQPPLRARMRNAPLPEVAAIPEKKKVDAAVPRVVNREDPLWPDPRRARSPSSKSSVQTWKQWASGRRDQLIRLNVLSYATLIIIVCLMGMSLISWSTSGHWYSPPPDHNRVI